MNPDMFETIGQVISSLIFGGKFDNLSDLQKLQECGFALFKSGMLGSHFNLLEFGGLISFTHLRATVLWGILSG